MDRDSSSSSSDFTSSSVDDGAEDPLGTPHLPFLSPNRVVADGCSVPPITVALRWREGRSTGHPPADGGAARAKTALRILRRQHCPTSPSQSSTPLAAAMTMSNLEDNCTQVSGLGMVVPHPEFLPATDAAIEFAVFSPNISVEGLFGGGGERKSAPLVGSEAYLLANLSRTITAELLQVDVLATCSSEAVPPSESSRSSLCEGGSGCQSAEVVTFGLGPQGCGKSTMLLGSVAAPLPCCADGRATAQYECTDLYTKVLQKVFKFGKRVGQRGVQVALSVVELRDAAPFRDPKMCHRPVKAIDLLTLMPATMLAQDIPGRVGNEPATASQSRYDLMSDPADIPAARYVSVSNVVEAVNVLYEALSSSICWKPRRRESSRAHHCDDAGGVDWPPLQPYGAPHEEKQGHLLITVLVGRSLSKGTKDHGTPGLSSTLGIWKLWDLAGPSVWTGYRPAPRIVPGQTMSLPLASSYSLPSLTHSCLTRLATSLLPSHESDVSHVIHETEALVQLDVASSLIASSIAFTASLVCVVTTTVADAALDELNREVLGAAAGWQDLGARAAQRSSFSTTRPECRVARRDENAMAGWRILDHYAIDATLFFSEAERSHQTCNLRSYNDAVVAGSSRSHEGKWQNSRSASESSVPAASKELQRWPKEQVQFVKDHRTPTSPVSRTETVPDLLPQGWPDSAPASFFHAPATADRVAEPLSINVTTVEEFGDCSGFSDALRLLATTQMNPARGDSWQRTTPDADSGDTLTDICKEELSKPPACDGPARRSPENETSVKFQANFLHDLRSNTFSEGLTESHQDPCREATIRTLTAGPVITASLAGDGTPPTAARSPPSVVQTGRRDMVYTASVHDSGDFGEVTDVTIELFGGAAGPLATPECRAAHEILPAGLNKDRATRPKDTPVISGPNGSMSQLHPSAPASLASALQPTLDRFRRICVEMTESMAAWKSEESATLCRLATLVESQEEELKCLSSVTLAQVAGRKIEADDLPQFKRESLQPLPDTSAVMEELIRISRDRSPTGSSLAVASSTNSLLYEQLLKSNEKIVWLEGQVILWRRRAREAVSSLPPASVPESMLISDGSGLLSEDVQPAIFSSPSPSEDPLQPYLASAINALRYLLKRCDAMYRRAQQGSARLQGHILAEQQTREQLMDRVVELEQELAQYRQRSCQVARNTKSLNTARARDSSLDSLGQTPLRGVDAPSLSRSRTPIRRETDIDSRRTLISSSPNTANRSPLSHHPGHRAATIGPWTPPLRASSPATRYRCTEWSPEAAGVATTTTTAVPTEVGGAELLMSRGVTPLPRPAPGGLASQSTSAPMPGIVERVVPPDPAQGTGNLSRPPTMAALPFNTTNPRLRRPAALKSRPRPTVVNSSDRLSTRSSASSPNAAVAAEELSNLLLRAVTCGTDRDASGSPVPSADGCCDVGRDATAERRVRPFDVRVRRSTSTESFTGFMSTPPCGSVGEKKMSGALLQSPATMRHPLTSASYATGDLHDRQYHNIELLGEARHCIDSTVTLEPKDGLGSIVEPKDAKASLALVRSGVVELTDYPSPSMAALKSAVGEVEESAIASLQLHIPTRAGETEYSLDASFYNAVSHLRAASRALQADTRQAAEREVEYLTALLSTPPTCEVRGRL